MRISPYGWGGGGGGGSIQIYHGPISDHFARGWGARSPFTKSPMILSRISNWENTFLFNCCIHYISNQHGEFKPACWVEKAKNFIDACYSQMIFSSHFSYYSFVCWLFIFFLCLHVQVANYTVEIVGLVVKRSSSDPEIVTTDQTRSRYETELLSLTATCVWEIRTFNLPSLVLESFNIPLLSPRHS